MLSSNTPTILRPEGSSSTGQEAWQSLLMCTLFQFERNQSQGLQSSHYEQHEHRVRTHAERGRQPIFKYATAKDDSKAAADAFMSPGQDPILHSCIHVSGPGPSICKLPCLQFVIIFNNRNNT